MDSRKENMSLCFSNKLRQTLAKRTKVKASFRRLPLSDTFSDCKVYRKPESGHKLSSTANPTSSGKTSTAGHRELIQIKMCTLRTNAQP